MRLLKLVGDEFRLVQVPTHNNLPYAILSHTWTPGQEVTYQELVSGDGKGKSGFKKITFCGKQAMNDGLLYFWVDTCCIDKSDPAELTTAINSMFRWYRNAAKCYVYLADVSMPNGNGDNTQVHQSTWEAAFRSSKWFTRGWTLQELIAPTIVEFFSKEGRQLGDKTSLQIPIHEITRIPITALQGNPFSDFSVKERKEWAAQRETTVQEDIVYCLIGLCEVSMPLLYGEGKEIALKRLDVAVKDLSPDINRISKVVGKPWTQDERNCQRALRTSEYERYKDRNPDRIEGTCQWLLSHSKFQTWCKSETSSLLWVSGDPGCGKSVLSRSLVDKELRSTETRTTCYFFFKDDDVKQKSATNALSALLHQLFSQKQFLVQHAMQDFEIEGSELPQSFHKLWKILTKAANDSQAGEVVCILDALDECEEAGRFDIINALSGFYKKQTIFTGRSPSFKFLATSRPYFEIERRFAVLTSNLPTVRLRGEEESDTISKEINHVIQYKVHNEIGPELDLDLSEKSALEKELLKMTHRTYLWLTLVFDVIRSRQTSVTQKRLQHLVATLPDTVDKAYEAILLKIVDKRKARKTLCIVLSAVRPLTLTELNIALSIEDEHRSYEDLDLEAEKKFVVTVRNLCGLFISIVDQKVYLIHQTAREFLIGNSALGVGGWKHSITPIESELALARTCITYLLFDIFNDAPLAFDQFSNRKVRRLTAKSYAEKHQYLLYASSFWATHYRRAQTMAGRVLLESAFDLIKTETGRFQTWYHLYQVLSQALCPKSPSPVVIASYFGHETVVRLLLGRGREIVAAQDMVGWTALFWASMKQHKGIVDLLLQARVDFNMMEGFAAAAWAATNGQMIVELLWGKPNVNAEDADFALVWLTWAAMTGRERVVQLLLDGRADIDADDKTGRTALSWAAANGQEAIVRLLLDGNADIDADDKTGRTALSWAAANGQEAIVRLLLDALAEVEVEDEKGLTPLLWAALNGQEAVLRLLLEAQANVNTQDNVGWTPLAWAATNGHTNIVQLLLENKVDIKIKDNQGQSALALAALGGQQAIVKLLLKSNANIDVKDGVPLIIAASYGNVAIAKLLLEFNPDINLRDKEGRTALFFAAAGGHEAIVKLLLNAKAKIDVEDNDGRTALLWAAFNGHEAIVKLLLDAKAKIDVEDNDGRTALLWAGAGGHEAIVKLLLDAKAKIDVEDNDGRTALLWAAFNGHEAIVKLLLDAKANIDVEDNDSQTALLWSAFGGHEAIVKLLLEAKANIDQKDRHGWTALAWAANKGNTTTVKILLEANANVEANNNNGRTALSWAAQNGHDAAVKMLLEAKAKLNKSDRHGWTALAWAANKGHTTTIRRLLEANADIETKDKQGRTALSLAALNGNQDAVKLLLDYNAAVDTEDEQGRTALLWASVNGHDAVVQLLSARR